MERVLSHDDTDQSEEQTSLLSESLIKRQCNCKPTYRVRKLKNKGAIIVFVWNFFIASVFNHLMAFVVPYGLEITMATLGLTLLLAGWLADIHFGHYKVIRWSMWIMCCLHLECNKFHSSAVYTWVPRNPQRHVCNNHFYNSYWFWRVPS